MTRASGTPLVSVASAERLALISPSPDIWVTAMQASATGGQILAVRKMTISDSESWHQPRLRWHDRNLGLIT